MKFYLLLLACLVDAKKQKKPLPELSSHKRPDNIPYGWYCIGCRAVIRDSMKKLYNYKKDLGDVIGSLEKICEAHNFIEDQYGPTEMNQGCESFIGGWEP